MSMEQGLSNLTLYDAKKYFRRAQNVVFNYTDMEAKVREATNNEPWGTSSTLMEQIAQGTYNYREREEVLGMIFRRFTEKSASEWRQIYKALQLLEYLVRHGAERFIDDVRANLSLVKMLETFHYIDAQGRDQGINVRNRSLELVKLLEDDTRIRTERKKARETAKKYKGVAGGAPSSYLPPSAVNRAAGFGKSSNRGISVSADFDSDEEDRGTHGESHIGTFKDATPPSTAKIGEPTNDSDDNDDDFADFQSAAPVTQPTTSNSQNIVDIFSEFSSAPVKAGNNNLASAAHNTHAFGPMPAVNQKVADPFGSLFDSAKLTKAPVKSTTQETSTSQQAPAAIPKNDNENDDDDDDDFGELETAAATSTAGTTTTPAAHSGQEPDLLSF
ncbi:LAFA_0A04984g1_1 [Lachancea sp. 'fantastica']|nr:LAFA_0A04984g1_1 [Lachancea sp. 'fantastica']